MGNQTSTVRQELEEALRALVPSLDALDLEAPEAAAATLNGRHSLESAEIRHLRELCGRALDEGWLTEATTRRNVHRATFAKDLAGYQVCVVQIEGEGLGHTHPEGEVALGFTWAGEPQIDGHAPGWFVYPPGSHHIPTVADGRMLILYFRPGGDVVWDPLGEEETD